MSEGLSRPGPLVQAEQEGAVLLLRISAPPLNLLTQTLRREIREAIEKAGSDKSVRAVILTGGANFCAGADLREFEARSDPVMAESHCRNGHAMTMALAAINTPLIAAIEGACLGGGLELALCCDRRVAATDARLGLPEISRGVFPGTGGIKLLERLVGPSRAKQVMMAGEIFDASSSLADGIVDERVAPGQALAKAIELGHRLAERSGPALQMIKRLTDLAFLDELARYLETERTEYIRCYQRADSAEGWRAFREKRPAIWTHS